MHGNVWEWCLDWGGAYPSEAQTDPCGPASGTCRVSRGGGWDSKAQYCRAAYRNDNDAPSYRHHCNGLRLTLLLK